MITAHRVGMTNPNPPDMRQLIRPDAEAQRAPKSFYSAHVTQDLPTLLKNAFCADPQRMQSACDSQDVRDWLLERRTLEDLEAFLKCHGFYVGVDALIGKIDKKRGSRRVEFVRIGGAGSRLQTQTNEWVQDYMMQRLPDPKDVFLVLVTDGDDFKETSYTYFVDQLLRALPHEDVEFLCIRTQLGIATGEKRDLFHCNCLNMRQPAGHSWNERMQLGGYTEIFNLVFSPNVRYTPIEDKILQITGGHNLRVCHQSIYIGGGAEVDKEMTMLNNDEVLLLGFGPTH